LNLLLQSVCAQALPTTFCEHIVVISTTTFELPASSFPYVFVICPWPDPSFPEKRWMMLRHSLGPVKQDWARVLSITSPKRAAYRASKCVLAASIEMCLSTTRNTHVWTGKRAVRERRGRSMQYICTACLQ
jgi:hypothetical protein